MTIGKPGTGAARTLSVHFRIVSVALPIIARHETDSASYGDAAAVRPAASRAPQRAARIAQNYRRVGRGCMLFTCLPEGAQIPGRFPGPAHARGKWFTIDIHCHLLTPKAEEMVASAGLTMDWQPRHQFANEQTKEVNREQARRTRIQFTDIATRLADMDRMGIDIQAITPSPAQTFYSVPADLGIETE